MQYRNKNVLQKIILFISVAVLFAVFSCADKVTDPKIEINESILKIIYPADSAVVSGHSYIEASMAELPNIKNIEFYSDNRIISTARSAPWRGHFDTYRLSDSISHTIYAKANFVSQVTNTAYSFSSPSITVFTDNTKPNVITDLTIIDSTTNSITIGWTAPGDNDTLGTATEYDIRYSIADYYDNIRWNSATKVTNEPTPQPAGSSESFTITDLSINTEYYIAIAAIDKAEQVSNYSNVVSAVANGIPPISDLSVIGSGYKVIEISWTVPDNPASCDSIVQYDIRYSTSQLREDNWDNATQVIGEPVPGLPGSTESMIVSDLLLDTGYRFGIKTLNDSSKSSSLSNIVVGETKELPIIRNFRAVDSTLTSVTLNWTAPRNDYAEENVLYYSLTYSGGIATDLPVPGPSGSTESYVAEGLLPDSRYQFNIKVCDDNSNCTFWYEIVNNYTKMLTLTRTDYPCGERSISLCSEDFDVDGDKDLAVTDYDGGVVSILINNGDATFMAPVGYNANTAPYSICSKDLNGDGSLDLAVTNFSRDSVSVLLNNGDGTFSSGISYIAKTNPISIKAEDIDNDGDNDLIVGHLNKAYISILQNDGTGVFSYSLEIPYHNQPRGICVADFNDDNIIDIATVSYYNYLVSVFIGSAPGVYDTQIDYGVAGEPFKLYPEDFDNDGDIDLLVANRFTAGITYMKNDGSGVFNDIYSARFSYINSLAFKDLTLDGFKDLVCVRFNFDKLMILKNNQEGFFEELEKDGKWYDIDPQPAEVVSEDFDNDGDNDVALVYTDGSVVSVFINNLIE